MKSKAIAYYEAYQKYIKAMQENIEKTIKEELGIDIKFEEMKGGKNDRKDN